LIIHIDNLRERERLAPIDNWLEIVYPDRIQQILPERAVSSIPRDLTEDQLLDRILDKAERNIQETFQNRVTVQQGRVNPLPMTKRQLKKARKIKRLQAEERKQETKRNQRLREKRTTTIK
jgi:hypothetical protein